MGPIVCHFYDICNFDQRYKKNHLYRQSETYGNKNIMIVNKTGNWESETTVSLRLQSWRKENIPKLEEYHLKRKLQVAKQK